jgi:hypothetical protein
VLSLAVSAGTGDQARTTFKEIGDAADAYSMSIGEPVAGGRGGAPRWRAPRIRLHRPTGIRNGGLLLLLVALAAVMALVDEPPEPGTGRRLPGAFQHLPPPVGITQLPPAVSQPPPTGREPGERPAAVRPASADRAHPRREHPRPEDRSGASGRLARDATRPGGGPTGTGGTRPPAGRPAVTTPPVEVATPAARVRVPPVPVEVEPPAVLGRDLPEVRAETPEVRLELPRLTAIP